MPRASVCVASNYEFCLILSEFCQLGRSAVIPYTVSTYDFCQYCPFCQSYSLAKGGECIQKYTPLPLSPQPYKKSYTLYTEVYRKGDSGIIGNIDKKIYNYTYAYSPFSLFLPEIYRISIFYALREVVGMTKMTILTKILNRYCVTIYSIVAELTKA